MLRWKLVYKLLLISILIVVIISPAFADSTHIANIETFQRFVELPNTINVEMYQLNPLDGSRTEIPCSDAVEIRGEYGCTAIPENPNFFYPYGNDATPDVDLEDYVLDVLSKEMNPNSWTNLAVLKAQAVASRSYASWYENNKDDLTTPFNNSASNYQVYAPFAFEWLTTVDGSTPSQQQTCASINLTVGQQRACAAVAEKHFIAQADNNPNHYPARANFLQDVKAKTDDGNKPYLKSVPDPISTACDAKDIFEDDEDDKKSLGMSQWGANRWVRGHECSREGAQVAEGNAPGGDWSVRWETAEQILTHYYTDIHLRDGADNNARLTPEYRWNPLSVSWSGVGCPSVIAAGGTCTATFHIQNTGTKTWFPGRANFRHRGWGQETSGVRMLESTTSLTRSIPPGDDVEVEITLRAGGSVESGERYQLRFEMGLEDDPGDWVGFSELEANRPWPTYDVRLCIDACRTHLPLLVKNWPPVYFFETFYPSPNPNWAYSGATVSPNGQTDGGALHLENTQGAQISITVGANSTPTVRFACQKVSGFWPRLELYLDGTDVTPGMGANNIECYDTWTAYEYVISDFADTSDSQVIIEFKGDQGTGFGSTNVLVDDIWVGIQ